MVKISIRIEDEQAAIIENYCRETGLNNSEVIRLSLEFYLSDRSEKTERDILLSIERLARSIFFLNMELGKKQGQESIVSKAIEFHKSGKVPNS